MIWLILILLLFCSGAVSASETALFSLPRKTLREFELSGGLRRRAARLMRRPRRVLMIVLVANTAANISIFAASYVAFEEIGASHPGVAAAGGIAVLLAVIFLGEVIPKGVALADAPLLAPLSAGLISALEVVLNPLQWALSTLLVNPITRLMSPASTYSDTVTTEELRLLVEHSARAGHIDSTENGMLQAIVGLGEASIRDVMTPRVDIESVRLSDNPGVVLAKMRASRKRVYPACGRDLDDIQGLLYARDVLLAPGTALKHLLRPVEFVPEQINLAQLMRHFRQRRAHFAIVVDEYGGTAGLVTNEDAVEWIVGDLPDEETAPCTPATERLDENTYRLSGDLSVREWADRFGVGEIDRQIDTLGGLILSRLGRLPHPGDTIRIRNLTLTVEAVDRRRIERVILRRGADDASTTRARS
jgi:CBS domain containing-hemolysin-like protein